MKPRTITVTGDAELQVAPDEAILALSVESIDKDLAKAKQANDQGALAILAAAEAHGLTDAEIAADRIAIEPRYEWTAGRRSFLGYAVRKSIALTLRDLGRFEGLLGAVLHAGATHFSGVTFRTSELRKHRDAARAAAIRAAKEKAEALAGELGQKLGPPRRIVEERPGSPFSASVPRGAPSQNAAAAGPPSSGGGEGATRPGTITVSAAISVTFELLSA